MLKNLFRVANFLLSMSFATSIGGAADIWKTGDGTTIQVVLEGTIIKGDIDTGD